MANKKMCKHPTINNLLLNNINYNQKVIDYVDHNYSSDASNVWKLHSTSKALSVGQGLAGVSGHMGGLINPFPGMDDAKPVVLTPVLTSRTIDNIDN